jgi:hypothetical protein
MKYIKRFNEEAKDKSIEDWCQELGLHKYEIVKNLVNVNDLRVVNISKKNLNKIPIQFGIIKSSFFCDNNNLTSLEGCPSNVVGSFFCHDNKLTTLEGGPRKVSGDFYCTHNKLTTLEGGPIEVGGSYNCNHNKIISLKGCPQKMRYDFFNLGHNPINKLIILFGSLKRYELSIYEYNYLRGANIIRKRLEKACEDAGIKMPELIKGYEYID